MANKGIAPPSNTLSWTGGYPLSSSGVALPTGRAMQNGSTAVMIYALEGYMSGYGSSRTVRMRIGSRATGYFTVGSAGSAQYTGVRHLSSWYLVNGGTTTFYYDSNGLTYFGRGGGGSVSGSPGSWSGTLAGSMYYVMAPTAPTGLTASSDSANAATLSWTAPSDHGGTGIVGYRLQYSTSPTFATDVTTVELGTGVSYTVSGLSSGNTYYFRVAGKNAVTQAAGSTSKYSATTSIEIASSGTLIAGLPPEFTENPGAFWSLTGHNVGFNALGQIVPLEEAAVSFTYYDTSSGSDKISTTVARRNAAWATSYRTINDKLYAENLLGDSILALTGPTGLSSVNMIAFKTSLADEDLSLSWQGKPLDSNLGTGQTVDLLVDAVTETLNVYVTYRLGGMVTSIDDSVDISGLDLTRELAVYLTYQWDNNTRIYDLYASIREADQYASSLSVSLSYTPDGIDLYTDPWEISGYARSLVTSNMLSGAAMTDLYEWENEPSYVIQGELPMDGPVVAYRGNVWEYMQMVSSATGCEVTSIGSNIVVRPVGERAIDLTNIVGSPTINPQSLMSGRVVEIEYTNAVPVNLGTIYDAAAEGDRVFTVAHNEIKSESVSLDFSAQSVIQPAPTGTYPNPIGTYYITDSEDQVVSPVDWVDGGGSVKVAIDPENADVMIVTLTGPGAEIPGSPGPYKIGNKVAAIDRGTLKIIGSGLSTNVQTLSLLTGANPDKTPQIVSTTITNPAIANLESAYDRGIWSSLLATVQITLSGTIPISAVTRFGLAAGSIITYADNSYRITSISMGNMDADFTAEAFVTVNDYSAHWADKTVGDHDAHWAGYDAQDERIMPFR